VIARADIRSPAPASAPRVSDRALTLWGSIRDLERHGFFGADLSNTRGEMTDAMRSDMRRLLPLMRGLLEHLEDIYEPA